MESKIKIIDQRDIKDSVPARAHRLSQGMADVQSVISVDESGNATETYTVGNATNLTPAEAYDAMTRTGIRIKKS